MYLIQNIKNHVIILLSYSKFSLSEGFSPKNLFCIIFSAIAQNDVILCDFSIILYVDTKNYLVTTDNT